MRRRIFGYFCKQRLPYPLFILFHSCGKLDSSFQSLFSILLVLPLMDYSRFVCSIYSSSSLIFCGLWGYVFSFLPVSYFRRKMLICYLETVVLKTLYCFFLCLSYYQFSPVCLYDFLKPFQLICLFWRSSMKNP